MFAEKLSRFYTSFFAFPPYRNLADEQADAVMAALALGLYADGAADPGELEELDSELVGIPQHWRDERRAKRIVSDYARRIGEGEAIDVLASELAPHLGGVPRDFVLIGAVFTAQGGDSQPLTEREKTALQALGVGLGLQPEVVSDVVGDAKRFFQREYTHRPSKWPPPWHDPDADPAGQNGAR